MKEKNLMIDRELSWIKFNERVLDEARSKDNPLMERMRFISIFQSNYEEFFRVRVGSIIDQYLIESDETDEFAGKAKKKQLKNIFNATKALLPRLDTAFDEILYKSRNRPSPMLKRFCSGKYSKKRSLPLFLPLLLKKSIRSRFLTTALPLWGSLCKRKTAVQSSVLCP